MNKCLSLSVFTCLFILLSFLDCFCLSKDEPEKSYTWQEMMDSCNAYQQAQDFQTALNWALQAEVKAKEEFGENDLQYADIMTIITEIYYTLENFDNALEYAKRDSTVRKSLMKEPNPQFVLTLNNLGEQYRNLGNYTDAEKIFNEGIMICKNSGPEFNSEIKTLQNNLALLFITLKRYSEATILANNNIEFAKSFYGEGNIEYTNSLNLHGYVLLKQNKLDSAEIYFAMAIEKAKYFTEESNPQMQIYYKNLAETYFNMKNYVKAEEIYEKILQILRTKHGVNTHLGIYENEKLIDIYLQSDRLEEAENIAKQSVFLIENKFGKNNSDYSTAINNLGLVYFYKNEFNKAEELFLESIETTKNISGIKSLEYATALDNLSIIYLDYGKYEKSLSLLQEVSTIRKELLGEYDTKVALDYFTLGLVYRNLERFHESEYYYRESLKIYTAIDDKDSIAIANCIKGIAEVYFTSGKFNESEEYYITALKIFYSIYGDDYSAYPQLISNLALLYDEIGRYAESEFYYKKALIAKQQLYGRNSGGYFWSINNLACLYLKLCRYTESELLLKEALEINKRIYNDENLDYSVPLNNLANLYMETNKFEESEDLFKKAINLTKKFLGEEHTEYARSLDNLGKLYKRMRKFQDADSLFTISLKITEKKLGKNHPLYTVHLANLAGLYNTQGRKKEAELLYLEALDIRKRLFKGINTEIAIGNKDLAYLYTSINNFWEAEKYFLSALEIYKNIYFQNTSFLSLKEKEKYFSTIDNCFNSFNSFTIFRLNDNPKIVNENYNNLLFTKGILVSSAIKMKKNIYNSADDNLRNLYGKWYELKRFISKNSNLTLKQLEQKFINLDSLEKVANEYEKELSLKSSAFATEINKKQYTWQDVRKLLNKNEAAIEIVRFKYFEGIRFTDTVYYAALILKPSAGFNPIEFVLLENGNDLEQLHIKNYKNCVKNKLPDNESYNQFWAKIAAKLKGVKKVYVSPDGVYNQLNLATLYNPKSKKYLLEEMEVQIVTSTRDLVINKEQKKPEYSNTAVLIGNPRFNLENTEYKKVASSLENKFKPDYYINDETELSMRSGIHPLPGTGIEVDKISQLLANKEWRVEKYTDNLAIEEAAKNVDNPRILHIATHGKFLSDVERQYSNFDTEMDRQRFVENPLLRSYLIFAGADSPDSSKNNDLDDGFLTAYEAQNLYLDKTELVVLSACETGLGEIKNGEGVYGLQRAFIQAGAKSIIMSLWSVSDEATQELMTSFYTKWLSGRPKRQAFKEAQLELKAKYPMPYYWGAFVMVGE